MTNSLRAATNAGSTTRGRSATATQDTDRASRTDAPHFKVKLQVTEINRADAKRIGKLLQTNPEARLALWDGIPNSLFAFAPVRTPGFPQAMFDLTYLTENAAAQGWKNAISQYLDNADRVIAAVERGESIEIPCRVHDTQRAEVNKLIRKADAAIAKGGPAPHLGKLSKSALEAFAVIAVDRGARAEDLAKGVSSDATIGETQGAEFINGALFLVRDHDPAGYKRLFTNFRKIADGPRQNRFAPAAATERMVEVPKSLKRGIRILENQVMMGRRPYLKPRSCHQIVDDMDALLPNVKDVEFWQHIRAGADVYYHVSSRPSRTWPQQLKLQLSHFGGLLPQAEMSQVLNGFRNLAAYFDGEAKTQAPHRSEERFEQAPKRIDLQGPTAGVDATSDDLPDDVIPVGLSWVALRCAEPSTTQAKPAPAADPVDVAQPAPYWAAA